MPRSDSSGYVRNSRDDVVSAALGILDQQGLPDLTMRHLATSLGVAPSALYWHFPNKQSLLAAVSDRIIAGARSAQAAPGDWRSAVRAEAAALHDALLAFKDGAEVVSSTLALGLGAEDLQRRLAVALGDGGFDDRTVALAAETMVHFVVGHAFHRQQRMQADSLGAVAERHSLDHENPTDQPHEPQAFDFGIALLVDGLEAHARTR
ncbi:TetR family transcriptional regulator [Asanoa ishikariensis]|uniref:Transcriptional regulator, TetR family n=1 Tax=Asanoa ishikariensis TaxID=137265 RepID=A0A1H3M2W3_9ACTN|nr:TetR family transcriptional regulator [Asanoa ishikariensis]GIF65879.1 TetR family transcriptional regulator [Asanoa ishikariensis]SDY71077.1 transcriptional regulator, TetR family [Asanoa ishikariensis]